MRLLAHFIVPGEPKGYTIALRSFDERVAAYHVYCDKVRVFARQAGLALPLEPTQDRPLWFAVWPFFSSNTHADSENVAKGIKDALCYGGKPRGKRGHGDDRWTGGNYPPPLYDAANPRTEVWVLELEPGDDWSAPDLPEEALETAHARVAGEARGQEPAHARH